MASAFDPPLRPPLPESDPEPEHKLIDLIHDDLEETLYRINELPTSINQLALWHALRFALSITNLIKGGQEDD